MSADIVGTGQTGRGHGDKLAAVEPGGNEPIPEAERHGVPGQLAWTWSSPNLEFATIFVGVLSVKVFGLSFWPAVLFTGLVPRVAPAVGDVTFLVGFVVAALVYVVVFRRTRTGPR